MPHTIEQHKFTAGSATEHMQKVMRFGIGHFNTI
jgi:hypothetical protein